MSVTLTQLRTFLAVVRTGSVRAAADELFVTQPSVSAAVSALARELGIPLLERDGLYARLWKRQTGGYIADAIEET